MAERVLGVDGGGSRTRAIVATLDGTVLGTGDAGSSNHQAIGFEPAMRALDAAIATALSQAGGLPIGATEGRPFAAACLGLAGVDRPADLELVGRWAEQHRLAARIAILNDAELVLAAGTPDGWGVALIAGTGSICLARSADGGTARAGGWGWRLGDEGSGYDVGAGALRLATQTADGRSEAPAVLAAVLRRWGLENAEGLLPLAYREGMSPAEVARLAVDVARLAEEGDRPARALLEGAGTALARHVDTVARRLGLECPPLALGGGLLRTSAVLRDATLGAIRVAVGAVGVVADPALGAIAIARRLVEGGTAPGLPPL